MAFKVQKTGLESLKFDFFSKSIKKIRKFSRGAQGSTVSNSTPGVTSYLKFLIPKVPSLPLFTKRLDKAWKIGLFSKYRKKEKNALAGNWTPAFCVCSRCANHYTTEAHIRRYVQDRREMNLKFLDRVLLYCHSPYIPRPLC